MDYNAGMSTASELSIFVPDSTTVAENPETQATIEMINTLLREIFNIRDTIKKMLYKTIDKISSEPGDFRISPRMEELIQMQNGNVKHRVDINGLIMLERQDSRSITRLLLHPHTGEHRVWENGTLRNLGLEELVSQLKTFHQSLMDALKILR